MVVHKEKRGDEIFIYMNGSLLYKIWDRVIRSSILFELYGPHTTNKDRDND